MADDLMALARDLNAALRDVEARAAAVLGKTASDIVRDAQQRAPVDTGFLRNSISAGDVTKPAPGSLRVEVGPSASYGAFVEYGTSRMAPRPFLGPASDAHVPRFEAAVEQLTAKFIAGT